MIKPRSIRLSTARELGSLNLNRFSFSELKAECKIRVITNSVEYKQQYKNNDFPSHPERVYSLEWVADSTS